MLDNKTILITGGTGFFGKRYVAHILERYKPKKVIIFSRDEVKQFKMSQQFSDDCMRYFIGDIRDYERLEDAMEGVDFVVHAASMKHLDSSEYNPFECIKTNILGAENLVKTSLKRGVKKVIALSVDRVMHANNISDATRLASEKLFVSANNIVGRHDTKFSVVRLNTLLGDDSELISFFEQMNKENSAELNLKDSSGLEFYLSLIDQSIAFTLKNFERMKGGEIFVPKVSNESSSFCFESGVEVFSGSTTRYFSGIDPERMLEFEDHFVICPTVQFANKSDFTQNMLGEKGSVISYGRQSINQSDIDGVVEVLRSDFLTQGPKVPAFEKLISKYCNANYGVAVNSATSALHIACLALNLGKGDILWTSPNTFVASANCGLYCDADVDFVDIDPLTYNMSVSALEQKLKVAKKENKLPKVVIPVHFAGQSCDMKEIFELSREYGFKIIEDASHAIGGRYFNSVIGSGEYSDITVFSFHPVKIITTAEGGMAVTNDKKLAKRMQLLRSHGVTRDDTLMENDPDGDWYYEQVELGFNYRMTEMQASLGITQMQRVDDFVSTRHVLQKRYDQLLKDLPVRVPYQKKECYSALHLYPIQLELTKLKKSRSQIFRELRENGIGVNVHYIPVHMQPFYQKLGFSSGDFPESEEYYSRAISIPLFHGMTFEQQDEVVRILTEVLV